MRLVRHYAQEQVQTSESAETLTREVALTETCQTLQLGAVRPHQKNAWEKSLLERMAAVTSGGEEHSFLYDTSKQC